MQCVNSISGTCQNVPWYCQELHKTILIKALLVKCTRGSRVERLYLWSCVSDSGVFMTNVFNDRMGIHFNIFFRFSSMQVSTYWWYVYCLERIIYATVGNIPVIISFPNRPRKPVVFTIISGCGVVHYEIWNVNIVTTIQIVGSCVAWPTYFACLLECRYFTGDWTLWGCLWDYRRHGYLWTACRCWRVDKLRPCFTSWWVICTCVHTPQLLTMNWVSVPWAATPVQGECRIPYYVAGKCSLCVLPFSCSLHVLQVWWWW